MRESAGILANQEKMRDFRIINSVVSENANSLAINSLIDEGGERFYNYIDSLGLLNEPDIIVLSSQHHYYYEPEELKLCNTVINLKELNQIKNIREFLHACLHFLPQKSNFIGCFIDNEKVNGYELRKGSLYHDKKSSDDIEYGIVSRFPFINMLYSLLDSRTFRYMSKMDVSLLLEDNGFKIINISEINGLTFFHSQKDIAAFN